MFSFFRPEIVLGMKYDKEAAAILDTYENPKDTSKKELEELIAFWHGRFSRFEVKTPSKEFNTMINTWNAYNCFMTFIWSRAASFIYCGLRNGYGYRDTVQDIQGIIHLAPEMALDKIRFMLSAQVNNGGGLPLVKFTHNPGYEDTPEKIERFGREIATVEKHWPGIFQTPDPYYNPNLTLLHEYFSLK